MGFVSGSKAIFVETRKTVETRFIFDSVIGSMTNFFTMPMEIRSWFGLISMEVKLFLLKLCQPNQGLF